MRTAFGRIHDAPEYTGRSIAKERNCPNTRLRKGSVIKIPAGEDIVSSPAGVFCAVTPCSSPIMFFHRYHEDTFTAECFTVWISGLDRFPLFSSLDKRHAVSA